MYEILITHRRPSADVPFFDWLPRVQEYLNENFYVPGKLVELVPGTWSEDKLTVQFRMVFASQQDAYDYQTDPFISDMRTQLYAYNEPRGLIFEYTPVDPPSV